jgi:hypothetical protein
MINQITVIIAVLMLSGCLLATDPAARDAKRQEKLAFINAVSTLVSLDERETDKYRCKSLGQVLGRGGMVPRSYDDELKHATLKAREEVVRAGGNAIILISSQISQKMPREVIVIAEALECRKIRRSPVKALSAPANPAPIKKDPAAGQVK